MPVFTKERLICTVHSGRDSERCYLPKLSPAQTERDLKLVMVVIGQASGFLNWIVGGLEKMESKI